ncbi:MAG: triple tyrosine motif-containing protein [Dyadobacter sp.]|uniref:sensor histidine kinase n=1 Tax=Dyadobacter sp. TaxID=1914288 RepID=UPI003263154D
MVRYLAFLLTLSWFSVPAQESKEKAEFPEQPSDKFIFDHFTSDNGAGGLGGGRIRQHNGFIWFSGFAAFNQMARFDGIDFKFAELYKGDSLIKASTFYYVFDRKGQLWYGARGNLFLCKKPDSWIKKPGQSGKYRLQIDTIYTKVLQQNFVTKILGEDHEGNLWIAQSSGKLYLFNPETGKRRIFKFPAGEQVVDWVADRQGRMLVISNKEIYELTDTSGNFVRKSIRKQAGMPVDTEFKDLFVDEQGSVWLGTDQAGVYQFQWKKSGRKSHFFQLQNYKCDIVTGIIQDKSDRIWIGTQDQGMVVYDYKTRNWEQLKYARSNPSGLNFNWIYTMHADDQGKVWIGSTMGGIDLFDPAKNHFRLLTQIDNEYKRTSETNYMYFGNGDSLYVFEGTQDYEMIYSVKERKYKHAFKNSLPRLPKMVQLWIKDGTGKNWFVNTDGLYSYDLKKSKLNFYPFPNSRQYRIFLPNTAEVIDRKKSGDLGEKQEIWIGDGLGLIRFDINTKKWIDNADLPEKLRNVISDRNITLIRSGSGNTVYLAGTYMPFVRYGVESERVDLAGYNKEGAQYTHDILEEKSSVWAATDVGLYELSMSDLSVKAIYSPGGNDYLQSAISIFTRDEKKHFWLFGAEELMEFVPGKGVLKKYRFKEEIRNNSINTVPAYRHQDGTIFFTGAKGITYFNPKDLKTNSFVPPVSITDIHVMGAPYSTDKNELRLTHKQNFVDFEFVALNFTSAAKNQYRYKMDGIDEEWIDAGTKRSANYTNLPPGGYTFTVIGSNNDGVWNKKGASVKIMILPPWWATWWFRSLLILLFASGIYGLFRYRLNQQLRQREAEIRASLMAQEAERQRFSRELHDGIGANLSLLKMYLSSFGEADIPMAELKERSEKLLAGSVDEIRRLIHDMHPRNLKEMGLVKAVEDMVGLVNLGNALKVNFNASNVPEHLPEQVEINLFRIVQELLQNAMKHSAAEMVWLDFNFAEENLTLTYKDNGTGFDTSAASNGNGLLNIRNRVSLLKGEIQSSSVPDQGTFVEICLAA